MSQNDNDCEISEEVNTLKKISKRQEDILTFIKDEVQKKGYPPSVREIGEAVGLASSSTVHGHLARLESKGLIRRDPTKPRAIEVLTQDGMDELKTGVVHVPLVGKVTAGLPITAIENIEDQQHQIKKAAEKKEKAKRQAQKEKEKLSKKAEKEAKKLQKEKQQQLIKNTKIETEYDD